MKIERITAEQFDEVKASTKQGARNSAVTTAMMQMEPGDCVRMYFDDRDEFLKAHNTAAAYARRHNFYRVIRNIECRTIYIKRTA